jgi:hypothetical protein
MIRPQNVNKGISKAKLDTVFRYAERGTRGVCQGGEKHFHHDDLQKVTWFNGH